MELFGTILRVAGRIAALLGVWVVIAGVISVIPIPSFDLSPAVDMVNKIYTICVYWIPGFQILWPIGLTLISLTIAYWTARVTLLVAYYVLTLLSA